jgi:mannitol 2-dehydrogenase
VTVLGRIPRDRRRRGSRLGLAPLPGEHDELAHIGGPPDGGHDLSSLGEARPDLAGYRRVDEAARDPLFQDLLLGYMDEEATPTLPPVPGIDLGAYKRTLIERFSNPQIRDTIARLCAFSSDRIPKWLLPVIRQQLATGGQIRRSVAVVASWARYSEGIDEDGEPIDIVDRLRDALTERARRQRDDPDAFIANRAVFGDLAANQRFLAAYRAALASLHHRGARATLTWLNE